MGAGQDSYPRAMSKLARFDAALAALESSRMVPIGWDAVAHLISLNGALDIPIHNASVALERIKGDPRNPDYWIDLAAYARCAMMILDRTLTDI